MTRNFTRLVLALMVLAGFAQGSMAQCGAGYNQAQVNWDNLNYYFNSGVNVAPYGFGGGNYVSNANQNTMKFGIGVNTVTIAMVSNVTPNGDNNLNTAQTGSYGAGSNVQYTTSAAAATMTLTFATDVQNLKFSIYDLDNNQWVSISAVNSAAVGQTVTLSKANAGSAIALSANPGLAPLAKGPGGNIINTDNNGTLNVDFGGSIHTVTITFSNAAGDFWLSDITACVLGSFPANYHQLASGKPFTGQPDYFLVNPDNTSAYYLDPATGKAYELFRDNAQPFINSLAYDQVNHFIYYVTDGSASANTNKAIKKYNVTTGVISTVVADITVAPLNIPTMDQGVESAGAAFYNGSLYLGIEGGKYNNANPRQTNFYRIDFDASFNAISAEQVYSTPAYTVGGTSLHDFGDFVVENGTLYDFNTARQGGGPYTYPNSSVVHFDMQMENITNNFINPTPANYFAGQVGLTWSGTMYSFWWNTNAPATGGVRPYNPATGTFGANTLCTTARGPAWPNGAGDASEPFKPPMDFGDAPASYDPVGTDPAVHEYDSMVFLGPAVNTINMEWAQKSGANANLDADDGMPSPPIFTHSQTGYDADIKVMNKSATNATVAAWIDFNNNGIFDPSEGITVTVTPNAAVQNVHLKWTGMPYINPVVTNVFCRIRITSAANGLTTSKPNGYFNNGEVEDYKLLVDDILPVKMTQFTAQTDNNQHVVINWQTTGETNLKEFEIQRSKDGANWETLTTVAPKGSSSGLTDYSDVDDQPYAGTSWYRLVTSDKDGRGVNSEARKITFSRSISAVQVTPNPFNNNISINLTLYKKQPVQIKLIDLSGVIIQQMKIDGQEGQNLIRLDRLNAVAKGLYILEIATDDEVRREKLTKQ